MADPKGSRKKDPGKEKPPGRPKGGHGKGETVERPRCECETAATFFLRTQAPPSTARLRYRWKIVVTSKSEPGR